MTKFYLQNLYKCLNILIKIANIKKILFNILILIILIESLHYIFKNSFLLMFFNIFYSVAFFFLFLTYYLIWDKILKNYLIVIFIIKIIHFF